MTSAVPASTARTRLRLWGEEDAARVLELYRHEAVVRFLGGTRIANELQAREHLAFLRQRNAAWPTGHGSFLVERRSDGVHLGTAIVKHLPGVDGNPTEATEIGWHLHPEVWGRGYATEVGRSLIAHSFDALGLSTLHAVVEPGNDASVAVTRRLGFECVGRTMAYYDGIALDEFVLSAAGR